MDFSRVFIDYFTFQQGPTWCITYTHILFLYHGSNSEYLSAAIIDQNPDILALARPLYFPWQKGLYEIREEVSEIIQSGKALFDAFISTGNPLHTRSRMEDKLKSEILLRFYTTGEHITSH